MATLHPQELLAAPASKALAWMDLLAFSERSQTVDTTKNQAV
jgi:DNA polymerase